LGAIRQLRWDDVDLKRNTIRWWAETDKKGKEWVIPVPASLGEELKSFRVKMGGLFGGLIFPSTSDPMKPVTRDSFEHLLATAERKAKLPKLDGSLWHAYRKRGPRAGKGYLSWMVAAAGGWSDIGTLMKCYQQADDVPLLEVMSHSKKISSEARAG
jgi:integrase